MIKYSYKQVQFCATQIFRIFVKYCFFIHWIDTTQKNLKYKISIDNSKNLIPNVFIYEKILKILKYSKFKKNFYKFEEYVKIYIKYILETILK